MPSDLLFARKQGFGYNISEDILLRTQWKNKVEYAFKNAEDFGGILNLDTVQKLKKQFDNQENSVSAMTIAKLFALFSFNQ